MSGRKPREHSYDNLKFLLIFFVVFAHLLEVSGTFPGKDAIYQVIYSFHMPAFLFVSGWFARFDRRKIVFQLLYLYLVAQLLYCLFDRFVLNPEDPCALQFTTPYWVLWYLLVLVVFHLLLPLLQQEGLKKQSLILAVLVVLSLLSGYDTNLSYFLALARILNFAPYFFLGVYARHHREAIGRFVRRRDGQTAALSLVLTAAVVLSALFLRRTGWITTDMMYAAKAYTDLYRPAQRLVIFLIALVWIAFLVLVVQRFLLKKIPVISTLGQNTLPIFLLHGFVVKYAGKIALLHPEGQGSLWAVLALAVAVLLVLGSPPVNWLVKKVLTGWWAEKLWDRITGTKASAH
jgi:fucose 4-O-acetylase-like acetyltransferase